MTGQGNSPRRSSEHTARWQFCGQQRSSWEGGELGRWRRRVPKRSGGVRGKVRDLRGKHGKTIGQFASANAFKAETLLLQSLDCGSVWKFVDTVCGAPRTMETEVRRDMACWSTRRRARLAALEHVRQTPVGRGHEEILASSYSLCHNGRMMELVERFLRAFTVTKKEERVWGLECVSWRWIGTTFGPVGN